MSREILVHEHVFREAPASACHDTVAAFKIAHAFSDCVHFAGRIDASGPALGRAMKSNGAEQVAPVK